MDWLKRIDEFDKAHAFKISLLILGIALLVAFYDYSTINYQIQKQNNICNAHWRQQIAQYCNEDMVMNFTARGEEIYKNSGLNTVGLLKNYTG